MSQLLTQPPATKRPAIPRLNNGDHLKRAEFERRYEAMPETTRAELIQGIVYMSPPARYETHGKAQMVLANWLGHYVAKTPGIAGYADNPTVRIDDENNPQPDLCMMLPRHVGGKAVIDKDDYIHGPPALVCEVAGSSVSYDLHEKKNMYANKGASEYLVWRTEDEEVDWFSLQSGRYVLIDANSDGTLRSKVFPGLWLQPQILLKADLPALFRLLDESTCTAEHAAFVQRMASTI